MVILHVYPNYRAAKGAFNLFIIRENPDRFLRASLKAQKGADEHIFLPLGLWSNFEKIQGLKLDRMNVYFDPNTRTQAGLRAFSHLPPEHIHFFTSGEPYAC